jgi:anaerobic selenocysteine-containing dehydrogenase
MLARVVNGRIVQFGGLPDNPLNVGTLCPKGRAQIMAVYDPYRMKKPLRRTNEKGVSGTWREVSWEEALDELAEKMKDVRSRDPELLLWQKGRSKAKDFYDDAFGKATGALKMGHGGYCSDAGYRACEYTTGLHGVLHPDFRHTNYLLSWGWDAQNAGGNKFCWLTWNQQLLDAKKRGMKMVALDPWKGATGPHADRWLPIKPGTDLAFFLALANVLIENGYVDEEYLKNYTNSAFLVQEHDGRFYRVGEKEQVWDTTTGSNKDYDGAELSPELDGEHSIGGTTVKTAFRLFKEHVANNTPEWASSICGLPAEDIRRVAEELGENAMIGSTIVIDGKTLPYRPAAIAGYHVTQQELGFQACRAALFVAMLIGSIEAVGGTLWLC